MDNELLLIIQAQFPSSGTANIHEEERLVWVSAKELKRFLEGKIDFIRMSASKEKAIYVNKSNVARLIFDEEEYNMLIKIKDLEDVLSKTDRDAQAKDIIKKDNCARGDALFPRDNTIILLYS